MKSSICGKLVHLLECKVVGLQSFGTLTKESMLKPIHLHILYSPQRLEVRG